MEFSSPDSSLGVSLYQHPDIQLGLVGENTIYGLLVPLAETTFENAHDLSITLGL